MAGSAETGFRGDDGPLRLPPTRRPKRRRFGRLERSVIAVVVVVVGALAASSVLNDEVTERLATVPIATTTTTASKAVALDDAATTSATSVPVTHRARSHVEPTTTIESPTATVASGPPASPPEVITALDKLAVAEEHSDAGRTGRFGYWTDDDHDGCNTRAEVLIRDSTDPTQSTPACHIVSGRWVSPYDNVVLTEADTVSIDHVVTIAEAWESGAWQWTDAERNKYVNDLEHRDFLVAVSGDVKSAKGDRDPGEWLPPVPGYHCDYLRAWVHVKTVYNLTVDPGERETIAAAALDC